MARKRRTFAQKISSCVSWEEIQDILMEKFKDPGVVLRLADKIESKILEEISSAEETRRRRMK